MTILEAKQTPIFTISDGRIEKTNMYDYAMQFVETATCTWGTVPRLHIREQRSRYEQKVKGMIYEVWRWGEACRSCKYLTSHRTYVASFKTKKEAEQYLFDLLLAQDAHYDSEFFYTEEEAKTVLNERS